MLKENLLSLLDIKFDHKLTKTTKINEFPEEYIELKEILNSFYDHDLTYIQLFAVLINGCVTEKLQEFLMSKRLLDRLVESDHKLGNIKRKTLNGVDYKTFKKILLEKEIVEITQHRQVKNHAEMWRIKHHLLNQFIYSHFEILDENFEPLTGMIVTKSLIQKKQQANRNLRDLENDYLERRGKDPFHTDDSSILELMNELKLL